MTTKEMLRAAGIRLVRILVAQLPALIIYLNGLGNPAFVLLGAVLNSLAKYIRDKYKIEWLPI